MSKYFQRLAQRSAEALGRGEKSDKLTSKLVEIEKKVEGIRNGCLITTKKLSATFVGSGSSLEKHQKRIPQYTLGTSMMEAGAVLLENRSLFGDIMTMVGQAQIDIASQMSQYEISVMHDIIQDLNTMLEEDGKKVDKAKKKLGNARLDMDSAKTRLRAHEAHIEKSTREYNMEKLINMRQEVDDCTKAFDDAQDAYATEMFDFLSKEQVYTNKIQELVKLQITHYKNAAVQLEGMLPTFEKKMNASQIRPVFGAPLDDHLVNAKQEIATVLEVCCTALRENGMDTEGLFRIAAGTAKVKFLKSAFDAGQTDVSAHDAHTIAGCLKMYLRELPEPLLTYDHYSDWIKGAGHGDYQERLQALWALKEQLPPSNLNNLKYLMAFLYEFSLYSEVTKMTVNNIAIVIGPNLLWPRQESADPLGMVTDTAMQRRITEILIEQCHWMFPDLPETPQPNLPPAKTHTTHLSSNSFSSTGSSSYSQPPLSPRSNADAASITSTGSSGSGGSPAPIPTPRLRERPPSERDLPHPLADNAQLEGVPVQMIGATSETTPSSSTPSPKSKKVPPPVSPYKPGAAGIKTNSSDPPSPVPKPRHASASSGQTLGVTRPPSGDMPVLNGEQPAEPRPTPPTRTKRASEPPMPASKPTVTPVKPGGPRGPSRKAPPPPVSKKPFPTAQAPSTAADEDEMSAL